MPSFELYDRDDETLKYAYRLLEVDNTYTIRKALKFWRMVLEAEENGGFYGLLNAGTPDLLMIGRHQRSFSTHKNLSPRSISINLRDGMKADLKIIMLLAECNQREAVCRALDAWRDVLESHEKHLDVVFKRDIYTEPIFAVILPF